MTEPDKQNTPSPQPQPAATPPPPQVPSPEPKEEKREEAKMFTQAEVESLIRDRLARETSKREDAEKKAREAAEREALAKNQEWEKLAKKAQEELEGVKREIAKRDLEAKRRAIALKVGIPENMIDRVRGETDEEITKDAQALLAVLPKKEKLTQNPTNPGGAPPGGETDAQKLARIHGQNINIFDPEVMKKLGGGVYRVGKKDE